jgi:DNA polymerase
MTPLILDFETRYGGDYTLKKMAQSDYIADKRFRALGFSLKRGDEPAVWFGEHQVEPALAKLKPLLEASTILFHHAHFDAAILAWHYGIYPKFHLDTMLMARALGYRKVSLAALLEHFNLGEKAELTPDSTPEQLRERGNVDTEKTWQLFKKLAPGFPLDELKLIDLTVRWFTEPRLIVNRAKLAALIKRIEAKNENMLAALDITEEQLQSAVQFRELLENEGVEIQTKPGKKGPIPCFAKTDEFMKELLDDENETVSALAAARLGLKSTGELTRAQRLYDMGARGPLPVYLSYYGAHPGRWSGGDSTNLQNLKRGGEIRGALEAPPGFKVVVGDLEQIECRGTAWLARCERLLNGFRSQQDVYSEFATQAFGIQVTKATHEFERFCGKFVVLGGGYGMGAPKCHAQIRAEIRKRALAYTPPSIEVCETLIDTYRNRFSQIPDLWQECRYRMLGNPGYRVGPVVAESNALRLPNGLRLHYPGLRKTAEGWQYEGKKGLTRLWGGKVVQNIMEALCRLILAGQMLRLDAMGYKIVTSTHDEIVLLVADEGVEQAVRAMKHVMSTVLPEWAAGIPLSVEIGVGQSYGDAK